MQAAPKVKQKVPFAVKHPKIHKHFRKLRRGCQVVQPILDAAGAASQIVTAFRR